MTRRAQGALRAAAALAAVGYLVAMVVGGALPQQRQRVAFEARGVMQQAPEQVDRVMLAAGGAVRRFRRDGEGWADDGGAPLPAPAASALGRAVKFMHTAMPVRVFEPQDMAGSAAGEFGLERPQLSIELAGASGVLLAADFGDLNADGFLQYMRVRGRDEVFLMSRFVGAEWSAVAAATQP